MLHTKNLETFRTFRQQLTRAGGARKKQRGGAMKTLGLLFLGVALLMPQTSPAQSGNDIVNRLRGGEQSFLTLNIYGHLEWYSWFNTAIFSGQDLILLTRSEATGSMGMSVRTTRLGLAIAVPGIRRVKLSGRLEFDFFGNYPASGFAENQPMPRLRHAFFKIENGGPTPSGLILGSTWSIVSPLFPTMVNPGAGWAMGNLWQRMPQLQGYWNFAPGSNSEVGFKLSLNRALSGASLYRNSQVSSAIDAGDTAFFQLQYEAHLKSRKKSGLRYLLSVSGALGQEDYTGVYGLSLSNASAANVVLVSVSASLTHDAFAIKGEWYSGSNIDTFAAQLGQGIVYDPAGSYGTSQKTSGFWVELSLYPWDIFHTHLGYGQDAPDESVLVSGEYTKNSAIWVTADWHALKNLLFRLSLINLNTSYDDNTTASGMSIMLAGRLSF